MSFDPFDSKHAKAILKKACKGTKTTTFLNNFQTVVESEMTIDNLNPGGVSIQLGEECLALTEIVAAARGRGGKVELPVLASDWLNQGIEFDDELAKLACAAVDKVRVQSSSRSIVEEMGGWPEWTNYCRGLSTRLKKPATKRRAAPKAEGTDAVIKRLRSKQCKVEREQGHVVELNCEEAGQLSDAEIADIIQLKKLKKLRLIKQPITDKSLGQLSALKQLRHLEIEHSAIKGRGFRDLDLPQLRRLDFGSAGINTAIANCGKLTGLREVVFFGSDITDSGLSKLTFAPSLEFINVGQCKKLRGAGFKALHGLKKLQEVNAVGVNFSKAGFEALSGLTSLKRLELMSAKITPKHVAALANLQQLESLGLSYVGPLTDCDVQFLARLRKLKRLELDRQKGITDETVKLLVGLPRLEELSLWACSITPASEELFLSMKRLNDLSIPETGFSRAAEKRLMKAIRK
jgi:hypothetical protein